ncbi:MAG: ATP-binding protein [Eggerthellaceae bacterium]|nr:ATP-binding protein [Eggerthellaceae bacterium]
MRDLVFSPAFGNRPSQLVGREHLLEQLLDGLETAPGSRERATVLLGQRGSGKTVLLWELADRARDRGFVVASPTVVSEGMNERIIEKIQDDGARYAKGKRAKIVGGSVGALGFSAGLQFSEEVRETKSFGYKMLQLARRLGDQGRGLLVLIDETQANSPELKQLIITYQELVGERQDVAIVLAGLPGAVSSVLNDSVLTFLNRATKASLEPLAIGDVDAFFARAFEVSGVKITADLRREAALATKGSPYLLQLIGHNLTQYADADGHVDERALRDALASSAESFKEDVCRTTLAALSERDVDFLKAMSLDEGASRIGEVAMRMGVTDDYAQKYRKRLIASGVIAPARRGFVEFAVPFLADHLRDNAHLAH